LVVIRDGDRQEEREPKSPATRERFGDLREVSLEASALIEETIIVDVNSAFSAMFGYEGYDLRGTAITDFVIAEHRRIVEEMLRARVEDRYETIGLHRDGTPIPMEITLCQVYVEGRDLWLLVVRDLHSVGWSGHHNGPQKSSQEIVRLAKAYQNDLEKLVVEQTEEIKKSMEIYRSICENAAEGIFRTTPNGQLISANPALAKMYGFDRAEEFLEKAWNLGEIYAKPKSGKLLGKLLQEEGAAYNLETELCTRDGSTKWARMNVRAEKDEKGDVLYYEGTLEDITETKRAEDKYRNIFLNATEGIFQITPEGSYLSANPALARIHGFNSPEELIQHHRVNGKRMHMDKEKWAKYKALLIEQGYVNDLECELLKKDGSTIWVWLNVRTIHDERGRALYYEGTVRDITEKKLRTEQILMQRNLGVRLARTSDVHEGLALILRATVKASGLESGGIWLQRPEGEALHLISSIGLSAHFELRTRHLEAGSPTGKLIMEGERRFMVPDSKSLSAAHDEGYTFAAIIPILFDRKVIGSFNLFSRNRKEVSDQALISLDFLAGEVGSIIVRIQVQQQLEEEIRTRREAEKALQAERLQLEEANVALKVLLRQREKDREELEEKFVSNVNELVLPLVEKLKKSRLEGLQIGAVDLIETNLKEIVSPFLHNIRSFKLTPRQLEIVALIKQGRTTKEIAELLHASKDAIDMQRFMIRKKMGLNKEKSNLRSLLLSLGI
jgi:PAS domain S-box-containing protein